MDASQLGSIMLDLDSPQRSASEEHEPALGNIPVRMFEAFAGGHVLARMERDEEIIASSHQRLQHSYELLSEVDRRLRAVAPNAF